MSMGAVANDDAIMNHEVSETMAEFLTVFIAGQRFGVPILQIQDVLGEQEITNIPLAPPEVAGSLNLRGRVVTAIDVRNRLDISGHRGMPSHGTKDMSVVVEHKNELYSLLIDRVGDVMKLDNNLFESNPATLDPVWQSVSLGIFRLEDELLVILDIPKLLDTAQG